MWRAIPSQSMTRQQHLSSPDAGAIISIDAALLSKKLETPLPEEEEKEKRKQKNRKKTQKICDLPLGDGLLLGVGAAMHRL